MGRPLPPSFHQAAARLESLPVISVDGIEITQTIQDLKHSVPLIGGKGTVARVYLTSSDAIQTLRGELTVWRADGTSHVSISLNTVNASAMPPGGLLSLRENLSASLNFRLPDAAVTEGAVEVSLTALTTASGALVSFVPTAPVQVAFVAAPPLRVRVLGLRYRSGSPARTYEPREIDYRHCISWLGRAYPVAQLMVERTVVDIPVLWPFTCTVANAFLAELRRQDISGGTDPRTHYLGLVSDGAGFMRGCASDVPLHPSPDTVASLPVGGRPWGWDSDGSYADWYGGHELAHTFGRAHPGFCGESHADIHFPYPNGQISTDDGAFVGLDFGDAALGLPMAVLPGKTWHDVMTYCSWQWISSYTYQGIHKRLMEENVQFGPDREGLPEALELEAHTLLAAAHPLVHVVATIDLDKMAGKIFSVKAVGHGTPSRSDPESEAVLELLDVNGETLETQPIRIKLSTCCEGESNEGLIDALLAPPQGSAQVRLLLRGAEVDRFPRPSESSDSMESTMPLSQLLQYFQQASRDGGLTWETVASQVQSAESAPPPSSPFPGMGKVFFRTIETDGFTSSVLRSFEHDFIK